MGFELLGWLVRAVMLIRFYNFEEASLFVAMKRADGYFAEVVHQNAGHIYGHMAVGGFAVVVSEEAAGEGEEVPVAEVRPLSDSAKVLAMLAILGALSALLLVLPVLLGFVGVVLSAPEGELGMFFGVCVFLFFSLWGMLKLTRVYRRPEHVCYGLARVVIGAITWVLIVVRILF